MKHRSPFKAVIAAGRFCGEAHRAFFGALITAYQTSKEFTEMEKAVCQITDSLENDLRPGTRAHAHGQDVKTIAEERREWVRAKIPAEVENAEITCIRAEMEAVEILLTHLRQRLAELEGRRGVVNTRLLEIEEARERMRKKAGNA
jgi:hypothetical protein